ncbi:MAG: hypothetical protein ACO3FI_04900 [Cyclobacteriaceae bacterium]
METFRLLLLVVMILSTFLTLLGLFYPWYALWWSPVENRLMVLKYYGITCFIAYLLWRLTDL